MIEPREINAEGPLYPGPTRFDSIGKALYLVERVLDIRWRYGRKEFFIKWEGYPLQYASWEPEENLKECSGLLKNFEKKVRITNRSKQIAYRNKKQVVQERPLSTKFGFVEDSTRQFASRFNEEEAKLKDKKYLSCGDEDLRDEYFRTFYNQDNVQSSSSEVEEVFVGEGLQQQFVRQYGLLRKRRSAQIVISSDSEPPQAITSSSRMRRNLNFAQSQSRTRPTVRVSLPTAQDSSQTRSQTFAPSKRLKVGPDSLRQGSQIKKSSTIARVESSASFRFQNTQGSNQLQSQQTRKKVNVSRVRGTDQATIDSEIISGSGGVTTLKTSGQLQSNKLLGSSSKINSSNIQEGSGAIVSNIRSSQTLRLDGLIESKGITSTTNKEDSSRLKPEESNTYDPINQSDLRTKAQGPVESQSFAQLGNEKITRVNHSALFDNQIAVAEEDKKDKQVVNLRIDRVQRSTANDPIKEFIRKQSHIAGLELKISKSGKKELSSSTFKQNQTPVITESSQLSKQKILESQKTMKKAIEITHVSATSKELSNQIIQKDKSLEELSRGVIQSADKTENKQKTQLVPVTESESQKIKQSLTVDSKPKTEMKLETKTGGDSSSSIRLKSGFIDSDMMNQISRKLKKDQLKAPENSIKVDSRPKKVQRAPLNSRRSLAKEETIQGDFPVVLKTSSSNKKKEEEPLSQGEPSFDEAKKQSGTIKEEIQTKSKSSLIGSSQAKVKLEDDSNFRSIHRAVNDQPQGQRLRNPNNSLDVKESTQKTESKTFQSSILNPSRNSTEKPKRLNQNQKGLFREKEEKPAGKKDKKKVVEKMKELRESIKKNRAKVGRNFKKKSTPSSQFQDHSEVGDLQHFKQKRRKRRKSRRALDKKLLRNSRFIEDEESEMRMKNRKGNFIDDEMDTIVEKLGKQPGSESEFFVVSWKRNKNGFKPKDSVYKDMDILDRKPELLLDFVKLHRKSNNKTKK